MSFLFCKLIINAFAKLFSSVKTLFDEFKNKNSIHCWAHIQSLCPFEPFRFDVYLCGMRSFARIPVAHLNDSHCDFSRILSEATSQLGKIFTEFGRNVSTFHERQDRFQHFRLFFRRWRRYNAHEVA